MLGESVIHNSSCFIIACLVNKSRRSASGMLPSEGGVEVVPFEGQRGARFRVPLSCCQGGRPPVLVLMVRNLQKWWGGV